MVGVDFGGGCCWGKKAGGGVLLGSGGVGGSELCWREIKLVE